MKILGIARDGVKLWMQESGYWTKEESEASEFCKVEAERRLRIINANNRFLDREDRVEGEIVESR